MTLAQCKEELSNLVPLIGKEIGVNKHLIVKIFIAPENQDKLNTYLNEFSLNGFDESKVEFSKFSNESLFIYVLYKSGLIFLIERYTDFLSKNGLSLPI